MLPTFELVSKVVETVDAWEECTNFNCSGGYIVILGKTGSKHLACHGEGGRWHEAVEKDWACDRNGPTVYRIKSGRVTKPSKLQRDWTCADFDMYHTSVPSNKVKPCPFCKASEWRVK